MSRSTQYIGLNKYALNYVKDAISVEKYEMASGLCDEIIYGNIYHMPVDGSNKDFLLKEIVQTIPWSSGPMIFTHLKPILIKKCEQICDDLGEYFSWMIDPSIISEYDFETGRYYV